MVAVDKIQRKFASLASDEQIEQVAKSLEANNIRVLIAENGEEARRLFFEIIPEGSEVFLGASVTLVVCWINNARNCLPGLVACGRVDHLPKMGEEPCAV